MITRKYKVIKEITEGWKTGAKVGDILTIRYLDRLETLFLGDKACRECCELIN